MRGNPLLLLGLVGFSCLLLTHCGGSGAGSTPPASNPPSNPSSPSTADFTLSASAVLRQVRRGDLGSVQISVTSKNGFAGTVTVSPSGFPAGFLASPIDITVSSNSTGNGTMTVAVSASAASGVSNLPLKGTSGALAHPASAMISVPLGGAAMIFKPRRQGQFAIPKVEADYLELLEADVAPLRLKNCGSATDPFDPFEFQNNSQEGTGTNTEGAAHYINITTLPIIPSGGSKDFTQISVYEEGHAKQYFFLHNLNWRAPQADIEGFAQACSDLVYEDLAASGKNAPKNNGADHMLWLDTMRTFDPEAIAAGSWVQTDAAYFQPAMAIGQPSFKLAGLVKHEEAMNTFASSRPTSPPTPAERRQIWDSTGVMIDGQVAGHWMSENMVRDPLFTVGKSHLNAWCEDPKFCMQAMAQAFTVTGTDGFNHPIVQPATAGPVTFTVKDASPQHNVVLTVQADFSETTNIANFSLGLPNKLPQGTYTVFVEATVNSAALSTHFPIANTSLSQMSPTGEEYIVAVDANSIANGGTLTVTRGTVVSSMDGFVRVKPDTDGTFDVTGPSGAKHTYTAPKQSRFIPVE